MKDDPEQGKENLNKVLGFNGQSYMLPSSSKEAPQGRLHSGVGPDSEARLPALNPAQPHSSAV